MLSNNSFAFSGKIIFELLVDIIFFPFWWYSRGLFLIGGKLLSALSDREKSLALFIWIKNIYRPMYGQYDWQGWLISFFMRVVQIIFRSIALLFWLAIYLAVFLFWLILPVLAIMQIMFQING
jgi:hypothetical protein